MKTPYLLVALAASLTAPACAPTTPPEEAASPALQRELNRADAIASARQDAARNYGAEWAREPNAQRQGGYWMVELHARSGYTLRYAISARDGSIRERSMAQ